MRRSSTSVGFLLALNAALLGGLWLTAGPAPEASAQPRPGFAAGNGRYTMIAARGSQGNDESYVYLVDKQTGATVPVSYSEGREGFRLFRGRDIATDAAAVAARR
ncbi:hypothetical protein [Phycisphaera mikurensis]|uniref:Uncharacterized protein n=1 Tax=Phycisphaera mikurensis (strain NBRC 102666 / KCTC 22515 / FYK2301M01) TaxID=1142394 RepID=I0IEH2_PHYMF|nr:hypothetical protein [Phycisphaera mikurensis]MBB6441459.1 hypothetical protein [Phycisphaera mikurensis]BAM03660.1 hypothetical protein PSMK_15010 [Phycisphaera mikurensis NBRC 102666]